MKEISRRDFLRIAGLTAAGLVLSACGYGKEKEEESTGLLGNTPTNTKTKEPTQLPSPSLTSKPTERPTNTPLPTETPTHKPTSTPTVTETPEPTFTPTKSPEQLLKERIARWEGRVIFLEEGDNTGGLPGWSGEKLDEYQKKREMFWGQVVTIAENQLGLSFEQSDLLVGGGYTLDQEGRVQESPFFALLITRNGRKEVYCFQNSLKEEGLVWSKSCLSNPSEIIWGSGFEDRVVKIKGVNRLVLVDKTGKEEKYYLNIRRDPLGQLETLVPVKMKIEKVKGEWVMTSKDYQPDSSQETLAGIILIGSLKNEEEVNHYLFECQVPPLPKGKLGLKDNLLTGLDIVQGRILVFDTNQEQKDGSFKLIGFWQLTEEVPKNKAPETIRWHSELKAYQDYRSLFKDIPPTATPTPKPTETPRPPEVVLPEIVYRIPPFPSNITIHTPGYWPDQPWGEYEGTLDSQEYHCWSGTFEGVLGIDSQNNVHVLVDLDIGPEKNIKEVTIPTSSFLTVFEIVRVEQGVTEIFSTTNPQEVLAVLSLPNWWKPHNDEPIDIVVWKNKGRISIVASRISMQGW